MILTIIKTCMDKYKYLGRFYNDVPTVMSELLLTHELFLKRGSFCRPFGNSS